MLFFDSVTVCCWSFCLISNLRFSTCWIANENLGKYYTLYYFLVKSNLLFLVSFYHKALTYYKATFCVKDSIAKIYFSFRVHFVLILSFTPWWKQTPKCLFHPVHWISQMNIGFSPSFTVSYVCFVLDLQQSVSHLHRLSRVDWVNESVCAPLYSVEQGQYAVTSEQANHSDCWTRAGSNSLGSLTLQNS